MPLSPTASISASQINTELGRSATATFSFNDATYRKLANQTAGTVDANSGRGTAYVGTTSTNLSLTTLFGPSVAATYKVLVDTGVTVGATFGNNALTVGQFPTGSTIIVNNYGSILAYGGQGGSYYNAGGSGGDAIVANWLNQTCIINNQTGALIYGGGGGGGSGGPGGSGGQGGGGFWDTYVYQSCGPDYNYLTYDTGVGCAKNTNYWNNYQRNYGAGGSGGGGGAGGAGGRGYGYDGANAGGSAGAGGAGGGSGVPNSGVGGTGGQGGTGGTGGGWGSAGNTGNTGGTGSTGANGNWTGGSAGSGGGGGQSGGAAGRYLLKGSASVTLNNSGGLAGGLA